MHARARVAVPGVDASLVLAARARERDAVRMQDLTIRTYAVNDAEAADRVLRAAFRASASFLPHLTRCARIEPEGFFVGCVGPRLVATGGAILYGDVAVVALVSVAPDVARSGIGARMLAHVEAWASGRGATTFLLDATGEGRGLYARCGYATEADCVEWTYAGVARTDPGEARWERGSLAEVIDYDTRIFGASRARALSVHAETCPLVVAREGAAGVVGYALVQPAVIGPIVADTEPIAAELVACALRHPFVAPPRILGADEHTQVGSSLRALGFARARVLVRMRKGPRADVGSDARLVGRASYATG